MDLLLRHGTGAQPPASHITSCLVDSFLESYVSWRAECEAVFHECAARIHGAQL